MSSMLAGGFALMAERNLPERHLCQDFLELLSSRMSQSLSSAIELMDNAPLEPSKRRGRKIKWSIEVLRGFLDREPKPRDFPRVCHWAPESPLEIALDRHLSKLRDWYRAVITDSYFSITGRVKSAHLLNLGLVLVCNRRYGGWESSTDVFPVDFSCSYLRALVENCFHEPSRVRISSLRLEFVVGEWEEVDPILFQKPGIDCLYQGLLRASRLGTELVEQPDIQKWLRFLETLPVVEGAGSQKMRAYLGQILGLAEEMCSLWEMALDLQNLPRRCPPGNLAKKMLQIVQGQRDPKVFARSVRSAGTLNTKARGVPDWEMLPPDWWKTQQLTAQARTGILNPDNPGKRILSDRLEYLDCLAPLRWHEGRLGEHRTYYVAEFSSIAVALCLTEGRALYVVDKRTHNWAQVLSLTKREALQGGAWRIFLDPEGRWWFRLVNLLKRRALTDSEPIPPGPNPQAVKQRADPMASWRYPKRVDLVLPALVLKLAAWKLSRDWDHSRMLKCVGRLPWASFPSKLILIAAEVVPKYLESSKARFLQQRGVGSSIQQLPSL